VVIRPAASRVRHPGYFGFFNRNKRSIAVDLKTADGRTVGHDLIARADILIENFRPGAMERLGLGYAAAAAINPRLIYASLKGFLKGPYDQRLALDEVVQMMSGLAYMTGPSGRPLRAGLVGGRYHRGHVRRDRNPCGAA